MKKVGVLYTSQSVNFAEKIAIALASSGYDSVMLEGGAGARMAAPQSPLIVIWSADAASSSAILEAAGRSMSQKTLVPISLGKAPPPSGFEHVWPMDLVGWSHDAKDPRWQFVVDEVEIAFRRFEDMAMMQAALPLDDGKLNADREIDQVSDIDALSDEESGDVDQSSVTPPSSDGPLFEAARAVRSDLGQLQNVGPSEPVPSTSPTSSTVDVVGDLKAPARGKVPLKRGATPPAGHRRKGATGIHIPAPALVAGAFALLFAGFIGAALVFAPRGPAEVAKQEEPPIVAFVEPTSLPSTDEIHIDESHADAPREVLRFPEAISEIATSDKVEAGSEAIFDDGDVDNGDDDEVDQRIAIVSGATVETLEEPAVNEGPMHSGDDLSTDEVVALAEVAEPVSSFDPDAGLQSDVSQSVTEVLPVDAAMATDPGTDPRIKPVILVGTDRDTEVPTQEGRGRVESMTADEAIADNQLIADIIAEVTTETGIENPDDLRLAGEGVRLEPVGNDDGEDAIAELAWSATRNGGDQPNAGAYFKECVDCPDMASLPTGSFFLGSPASEAARQTSEGPRVEIALNKPIAFSTREITFEQWDACAQSGACRNYRPSDSGWGRGKRPVINISFEDALAFCQWLSRRTGAVYRLPSEAEWEYAARAGTSTPFWFGGTLSPLNANYHGEYPYSGVKGIYRRKTTPTASFEANPYGLYDLHGNVWEWTADCWNADHRGARADGAPRAGDCSRRVVKGGAWNAGGWRLRVAHRLSTPIGERSFDTGFRVVRELN